MVLSKVAVGRLVPSPGFHCTKPLGMANVAKSPPCRPGRLEMLDLEQGEKVVVGHRMERRVAMLDAESCGAAA